MSRQRSSAASPSTHYVLSDAAHGALLRIRDHLRLLARMTAAGIVYEAKELHLSPDALTTTFQRLANDLDGVLHGATPRRS
ncbi:XAC0095 family protein [Lysobacter panacisoli]|uniref:XAC0095-like domain-containing protein n=1 Tax=Lysobacter panacisoli TaxID=1255263 RepID=A0ABP9L5U0_9GAMM|nr:hypothetical protein [Lysobacter panacisoli]